MTKFRRGAASSFVLLGCRCETRTDKPPDRRCLSSLHISSRETSLCSRSSALEGFVSQAWTGGQHSHPRPVPRVCSIVNRLVFLEGSFTAMDRALHGTLVCSSDRLHAWGGGGAGVPRWEVCGRVGMAVPLTPGAGLQECVFLPTAGLPFLPQGFHVPVIPR